MAGTATYTHKVFGRFRRIVVSLVADAADGSFPPTALPKIEGQLRELHTNPGTPAPTANYDVALNDGDGVDRLQAAGQNRHTANSEVVPVVFASTSQGPTVGSDETLTLAVTGNSVNSAVIVVTIVYESFDPR